MPLLSNSCTICISIHALAKRATLQFLNRYGKIIISIHALAKRATRYISLHFVAEIDFNPRPRKEGDQIKFIIRLYTILFQSTPSQRGRLAMQEVLAIYRIFQSTPSQRGRLASAGVVLHMKKFQSTPSQRGRHV